MPAGRPIYRPLVKSTDILAITTKMSLRRYLMTDASESLRLRDELQEFYDDFRTACMAKKYYSHKLLITQRISLTLEVALAIGASGSFASLKPLADYDFFKIALPYFAAATAILAIIKPFLGLQESIERYSKLVGGYTELVQSATRLIREIKRERALTQTCRDVVKNVQSNIDKLVELDDLKPRRKLLAKFQTEVVQEYALDFFYWPHTPPE
jgi:hypothetical protein